MTAATTRPLPRLHQLPSSLPADGSITISLEEGAPVFRASPRVQARVVALVDAESRGRLSADETDELDAYEEIDDYLSHLNRATIDLLAMNRERVVAIRRADLAVGRHPPAGDPVLVDG